MSSNTFTFTEFTDEDCIDVTASPDQRLEDPEFFLIALGRQTRRDSRAIGENDTVLVNVVDTTIGERIRIIAVYLSMFQGRIQKVKEVVAFLVHDNFR